MNPSVMKLLDFRLHDFTRYAWASDLARDVWQPRIAEVADCWEQLELLSVAAGLRRCALKIIPGDALADFSEEVRGRGLSAATLDRVAAGRGSYSTLQSEATGDGPFDYRVVVGSAESVELFRGAWAAGRQTEVGDLLGYPACCSRFFEQVWCADGLIDTTWPMTVNTAAKAEEGDRAFAVEGAPQANILLRWLGLRAVFHLPCRFDCEATTATADRLLALGRESGYAREMACLTEALSWPVEWSALHGIAEIKTPLLKITALTDATAEKYVVRRRGDAYPAEGALGLGFPYTQPARLRLSDSEGFRRGIRNPIRVTTIERRRPAQTPEWLFKDNGFASASDMNAAHEPLVELAVSTLDRPPGPVLDLGCGNGALLRKILQTSPGAVPFGVDVNPAKVAHARMILPEFAGNFVSGDMFATDAPWPEGRRYALAILMLGRLLEVSAERAAWLKARLKGHASHLIVYSYDLAGTGDEGLLSLATQLGIKFLPPARSSYVRLAQIP
jgi:Methyltransferase domain